MRCSQLLLATLREAPADAEIPSHRLMARAGIVRKLASGLYSWLPLGLRVLRKVEAIIREEMHASGAQELLLPLIHPAEFWQASGRWDSLGPELLRLQDRHNRDYCLAPTHEEVIADIARRELTSYRQLPINLYQIQLKFRDEMRPRFGVMRAREFMMMDGYSFHADAASLEQTYFAMYDCYCRIFDRLGLAYRSVLADSGNIGGKVSHEFQALAEVGEDTLAISDGGDYAANLELAECAPDAAPRPPPGLSMEKVSTPNISSIDDVCALLDVPETRAVKTLIVRGQNEPMVAIMLRGNDSLNTLKAARHPEVASPLEFVEPAKLQEQIKVSPGSIGPCGLDMPVLVDHRAAVLADFICGANEDGYHFVGANWGRDAHITQQADFRNITEGEPSPDGKGNIRLARGIEVGHIFQLGEKYAKALSATFLDDTGKAKPFLMGCYGIGVSRIVAALIEQNHDDKGIVWPVQTAPFQVVLIPLNYQKSAGVQSTSDVLYQQLLDANIEVLMDDRKERPGVKFVDSELIGIPYSVVIGERGLNAGKVELRTRRTGQSIDLDPAAVVAEVQSRIAC